MPTDKPKIVKTEAEWRALLTPMQYEVTRRQATERPGTGPYLHEKRAGLYQCVACGAPLFRSEAKYDSGCGWPSFYQPVAEDAIAELEDVSHFMHRTEIRCPQCDAHIGHVFPDGPQPTGLRYCTNGTALKLAPDEGKEEPGRGE